MEFLDCNCYFGRPSTPGPSPAKCPTAQDLVAQLRRAGIQRAVTWHIAQHDVSPQRGNEMLLDALREHEELVGCWTLLPYQTGEMPVGELIAGMKEAGIVALRAFPDTHRYLLNGLTLGRLLEKMVERRIPLIVSMKRGTSWRDVYHLLKEYPNLTLVITDHGSWGCDRFFRPLLEEYGRVYIDTTLYFLDGGIEGVVRTYGSDRILFGSGLPDRYAGGMMMYIRHCDLPEEDKAAVAGGNLKRLLEEVEL